jgi:hypothetical protein
MAFHLKHKHEREVCRFRMSLKIAACLIYLKQDDNKINCSLKTGEIHNIHVRFRGRGAYPQ